MVEVIEVVDCILCAVLGEVGGYEVRSDIFGFMVVFLVLVVVVAWVVVV